MGIKLRIDQLAYHQNVWGIDWLNYYEPQARHLRGANIAAWAGSWEGLHPPLSGAIHGLGQALGASFGVHWAATVAAGLAAAMLLGWEGWRRTSVVAFVATVGWLALSPMQANYGLNTSPYPWALLGTAGSTVALLRALERDTASAWWASAWISALAAQVHLLTFAAVLGQILFLALHGPAWLRRRKTHLKRWGLVVGISGAVLVGMSIYKTLDPWTFHITEEGDPWWSSVWLMLGARFGEWQDKQILLGILAGGVVAGLAVGPRKEIGLLLLQALGFCSALLLFYEVGVADPRLTHYFIVPQLLLVAAAAWGLGALASKGPLATVIVVAAAVAGSWGWAGSAAQWFDQRESRARETIEASAAGDVVGYWRDAGRGDMVAYLWDHTFLNDEPQDMDPISATWPTWRTGRPCFDIDDPRLICNRHGGAHFYFAPSAFTGEFESLEETLRIVINTATEPGRAVIVISPNLDESPPQPWPMEPWLREHGGVMSGPHAGGVVVYEFPVGTVIAEPPPENPGG